MPYPRDLEHDLEDTIPAEGGPDSRRLFAAMTRRALDGLALRPGGRVLDLACGMGQDTLALAERQRALARDSASALAAGLEPSDRMIRFGQGLVRARAADRAAQPLRIGWVRGFAEALPFRDGAFDAVLCKGAMDHFRSPAEAMAEIARVLRPGGRLVLALANYDSLSCRLGRARDRRRAKDCHPPTTPARPYYEPPPDHLVRFGYREILALVRAPLRLRRARGLSLLWLYPPWSALLARLPSPAAALLLALAFAWARALPSRADVILLFAVRE